MQAESHPVTARLEDRRLPLRSVFIGSVNSSYAALSSLFDHRDVIDVVAVLGLAESASRTVSGYRRLDQLASSHGCQYLDFERINDSQEMEFIRKFSPDLIWVVGLSQLVGEELRELPSVGCIGFHPTMLPEGRGRAPVAWSVLGHARPAATFFFLEERADSGAIIAQVEVDPASLQDSQSLIEGISNKIPEAISQACLNFATPAWHPVVQEESDATYLGVRRDEDGAIDWSMDSSSIDRLIRSASTPYPGAWTFSGESIVRILRCGGIDERFRGVPGRILDINDRGALLVATGDNSIWVDQFSIDPAKRLRVGMKLGKNPASELFKLRLRIAQLERELERLDKVIQRTLGSDEE